MSRAATAVIALALVLSACTSGRGTTTASSGPQSAVVAAASPTTAPAGSSSPSASASASASAPASPSAGTPASNSAAPPPLPLPTSFGSGPAWPRVARSAAPPAYGAVRTKRIATITAGDTLARGLLLPRLDASAHAPLVMTPCGRQVRLRATDVEFVAPGSGGPLPKPAGQVVALIDPGHGGPADGAIGVDGSREADRVLDLARQVARYADARLGRVYLTRDRDMNSTLEFRTTLGDALRVDVAVAVHLNAEGRTPLDRPGVETFAAASDPQGRRLAGVMYEAERRFLQQFPGPWVGYADAGAKYRLNLRGIDYYGLLRRSHRPWVISESLFMTSAHDIALLDRPAFVSQLAATIAGAAGDFTTTRAAGSGWRKPRPPVPDAGNTPPEP
ncbi:MAG: N-acetylmuramoyl-L-alanine amidase, partial [Frankiaceae bacterium]|nr:N-acetylmuramoyl-L-alanine amidase [Frankiaceae bacterium]